ncbi:MAG: hypothetical protein LIO53_03260 [Oscillospiraceae bacterium]|nr:hypothetical protein [Oscillospiraceae bacterium]
MHTRHVNIKLSILTLILFLNGCSVINGNNTMPTYEESENILTENLSDMELICDYLYELEFTTVYWWRTQPQTLSYSHSKELEIPDLVKEYFDRLYEQGYSSIVKDGDSISFTLISSLDSSCGFIYCETEPSMDVGGDLEIKKLYCDNWYYYTHVAE